MPNTDEIEQEFKELELKIERLKNAESELNTLAGPELRELFPNEISAIEAEIKDPRR